MNNRQLQSLFLNIAVVLAVALIAGTLWLMYQGKGFKKYTDARGQFAVKYPETWEVHEGMNGANVVFNTPLTTALDLFQESVNVVVQDMSAKRMGLREYTEIAIYQMRMVFKQSIIVSESIPVMFAGIPGHKFAFTGKGPQGDVKYMIYWTVRGNKAYQLTYTAMATEYDTYLPQFEKMVQSFKIH